MSLSLNEVKHGEVSIIFGSPESILDHSRNILLELSKKHLIKAVFVDEAHCIKKYGKPDLKKKDAFRPFYGRLSELRSLVGHSVPVIALTATASEETKHEIMKDLSMDNCEEVILNPNKANITYWVLKVMNDDVASNFQWLVKLLGQKKQETPRMLIFFRQIKFIAEVFELLETSLGKDAYVDYKEGGPNDDRNRLFEMFHMKTDEVVKQTICASYQDPKGNIRVVLCSTSFSMGLDVKDVDTVIHYGPANEIDDYIQETGRAGRDNSSQSNAIFLNYKRSLGSKNISSQMKEYAKTSDCRRNLLLNKLGFTIESTLMPHLCCDNCRQHCKCLCSCINKCSCTLRCESPVPSIVESILEYEFEGNLTSGTSSDCDSDDELLKRKPVVLFSSDEDI